MYIIVDTETTGLPTSYNVPIIDTYNWPRIVQFSWQIHDILGDIKEFNNFTIIPENYDIPFIASKIHGITNDIANKNGVKLEFVIDKFKKSVDKCKCIIGHNIEFDLKVIECEFLRKKKNISLNKKKIIDTKLISTSFCKINTNNKKRFKWPTLSELYYKLFEEKIIDIHNSKNDVKFTARCFFELLRIGIISDQNIGKKGVNSLFKKNFNKKISSSIVFFKNEKPVYDNVYNNKVSIKKMIKLEYLKILKIRKNSKFYHEKLKTNTYSHIHNHTHFSILRSTINIKSLIKKAIYFNMPAVGITDYGNMMGAYSFLNEINSACKKYKKSIKGIVGCEVFISENYLQKKFSKNYPDKRYQQVLLSKNKKGYKNLVNICSYGYIYGLYSGIPRIDKKVIEKYKENIIAITGDINSEIPYYILNYGVKKAEKLFIWWKETFEEDFYIELLRHGLDEENYVNNILLKFAYKYNVKYIAQNNVFYLDKLESNAHDILLCIKNGDKQQTPIGKGNGFRFGFPNKEFYFKNFEEMKIIFSDFPESFLFLNELIEKIENYHISNKILLPKFNVLKNYKYYNKIEENNYLKKITYSGAKKRYKYINNKLKNRIEFELNTIKKIGYPGYFLIVRNFINKAKSMNISVGPGRGSVAGSVVAYCIGITNINPIKYQLLFERFLNTDRVSLPDIDIDFDDEGRDKIIEWAVQEYGKDKVAQIITYATMGAKSSIRDVGRVLGLSLKETDKIAKMIPNNISLKEIFSDKIFGKINKEEWINLKKIKYIANENNLSGKVIKQARIIEGTIRSTGIHACGIIISSNNIQEYVPVSVSKDSNLLITQFDNNVIESTGLLKMDFLGLKTLTIIKNTINLVKKTYNKNISFDLKDKKTYELFKKGETIAVFQYESVGMQKYLIRLKPDKFVDLIAMNALYRPGPIQYIPNFINRKNGKEPITYDLPEMEEFLKETYGITIYQEQVMLISQKIAGFSKVEADILRKSMGKKEKHIINDMKYKFINKSIKKGYPKKILYKIWKDWEFFSCYAFNKSHATCYSYIAFKTAYLKTHFPCEYMTSVLSSNMQNIKQLTFFIKECKRINLSVINPHINKSESKFIMIKNNKILFGMNGIKGVGENSVRVIIKERDKNGPFLSIFDLVKRVDLRIVNKKTLESLILSGSLDCFNIPREQYFLLDKKTNLTILEKIIQFESKSKLKKNKKIERPIFINFEKKWDNLEKLYKEKEVLGIYLSSHPLDNYYYEIKYFTNISIQELNKEKYKKNKIYTFVGILSNIEKKYYNKLKYGILLLEDYNSYKEFRIYGDKFERYESILNKNSILYLFIYKNKVCNILHIEKLNNFFNKIVNILIIKINLNCINYYNMINVINEIYYIVKNQYIGDKKLFFIFYDTKNKINFKYEKSGITITSNFLSKIRKIKGVTFYFK